MPKRAESLRRIFAATSVFLLVGPATAMASEAAETASPAGLPGLLEHLPSWLRKTGFLLEHWQWLGLLGIIVLGVILAKVTTFAIARLLHRLLKETPENERRKMWSKARRPFGALVIGGVFLIFLPWLGLAPTTFGILNLAATVVSAAAGVWAAYRIVDILSLYLVHLARGTESKLDDMLIPMLRKIVKIFVVAIGGVFVAQNLDIEVGSLLAGLGLGGLAFALAAKDTVANIFGSITVLLDQPFQVGDWVVLDGIEGTVERVGFRSTRIRTFYNSLIAFPNAKLISGIVDNYGARRYRRYSTKFGISFDTPPDTVEAFCEGLREIVRIHPYTRKDYFHVYLNGLADSWLEIMVYIFHECPDWGTELRERHRFLLDALRLAERLGVTFAFPTQTVLLEKDGHPAMPEEPSTSSDIPAAGEPLEKGRKAALAVVRQRLAEGEIPPPM
jgi:MscS family membrane protein